MPRRTAKALTEASVQRIKAPDSGRREHFDSIVPGFALRVTGTGHKSWVMYYRRDGRNRRYTIGTYPAIELKEAREIARSVHLQARQGGDPAADKKTAEAQRRTADSFGDVVGLFVERYAKKNKSWPETQRIFDKYVLPTWAKRDITTIARRDVVELMDFIEDNHGTYMANRSLAAVRKLFNWCVADRGILEATPIVPGMARGKETKRERWLRDEELKAVWNACDVMGNPFGPFIHMLMVTGQRVNEVAHMRWQDLDLEDALWTLPRGITKADREHEVPLSTLATEILGSQLQQGDFVFTSGRKGDRPVSGFSKAKKRCDDLAGISDWRLHDLRRTVATHMRSLHIERPTVKKILNHAENDVTAVYDRHAGLPEKCRAMEIWAQKLGSLISPTDDNVVELWDSK